VAGRPIRALADVSSDCGSLSEAFSLTAKHATPMAIPNEILSIDRLFI
jgi:hypothetical protein